MDTISHSNTSFLGKFYMHQEHNAPFMTKNVNLAFFSWTLLGHSKKISDSQRINIRTNFKETNIQQKHAIHFKDRFNSIST